MRRRALLSSIAAGAAIIAGCSGLPDSATTDTTHRTTRTTETTDGTRTTTRRKDAPEPPDLGVGDATTAVFETRDRTLSLLDGRARLPSGLVVQAWLSATATADHPARVTATLTNDTEYDTARELDGVGPFDSTPFARPDFGADHGIYLAPTENHEFATKTPAVARADDGGWYLDDAPGDWQPRAVKVDAGDTLVAELAVVADDDTADRFSTGRYRFGHSEYGFSLVAWQTSQPGPTEPARFAGASPPPLEENGVRWYHDATTETETYLQASPERLDAPGEVEFTLHNYLTESLTGNVYDWELDKRVDGEWYRIAPRGVPVPLTPLAPGDTHTWSLHAFDGEPVFCDDAIAVGHLGGGRYAFEVNMHREDGPTHAALLDIAAPEVGVTPTDDASATREGATVTVTSDGYENAGSDRGTLVVERADTADLRLISEQVMQPYNRGFQNTLPFFDSGVTRVELRTDESVVDNVLGYDNPPRKVRFDGTAYRATRG